MAFPLRTVLIAAAVMAVVAMILRRLGGGGGVEQVEAPPTSEPEPEPESAEATEPSHAEVLDEEGDDEGLELDPHDVLFVTSNGEVFLPLASGVRVLDLGEALSAVRAGLVPWEAIRQRVVASRPAGAGLPGMGLDPGDFTAGRVIRGAPDLDPWRLELLGRDGEYQPYAFETEEAARGALALLEARGVIRRPLGDDDQPVPVPTEEFDEARRRFEDTLEELAMMPDVEPGGGPRDPSRDVPRG